MRSRKIYLFLFSLSIALSQANFSSKKVISDASNGIYDVQAIDIDNDGDIDLVSALLNNNLIAWYENDGNSNFTRNNISTNIYLNWNVQTPEEFIRTVARKWAAISGLLISSLFTSQFDTIAMTSYRSFKTWPFLVR